MNSIFCWNITSIRKLKNYLHLFEKYNIIAFQEIRYNNIEDLKTNYNIKDHYVFWSVNIHKAGYSGCGLYVTEHPISVIIDKEDGRYIILEYSTYYLINVYVMNSGAKLEKLDKRIEWDKHFKLILNKLSKQKNLIIVGDFNCAHKDIDVYNPSKKTNKAGFTLSERNSFQLLLNNFKLIDVYRYLYPNKIEYTYFTYYRKARLLNKGWRLDYLLVSDTYLNNITHVYIDSDFKIQEFNSDHLPIIIKYN